MDFAWFIWKTAKDEEIAEKHEEALELHVGKRKYMFVPGETHVDFVGWYGDSSQKTFSFRIPRGDQTSTKVLAEIMTQQESDQTDKKLVSEENKTADSLVPIKLGQKNIYLFQKFVSYDSLREQLEALILLCTKVIHRRKKLARWK